MGSTNTNINKWHLRDLFLEDSGKASTSKLAQLVALMVSTWAILFLTLHNNLTEGYFLAYIGAWVVNRGATKYFNKKADTQV